MTKPPPENTPVIQTHKGQTAHSKLDTHHEMVTRIFFNRRHNPGDDGYAITHTTTHFEQAQQSKRKKKQVVIPRETDEIRVEGSTLIHTFGVSGPTTSTTQRRVENEAIAEAYKEAIDNAVADGYLTPLEEKQLNALRLEIGTTMKDIKVTDEEQQRVVDLAFQVGKPSKAIAGL